MSFLGVGAAEVGMILLIALILIGPQNFPQVMRQAGRWYRVARAFSGEIMKDVRSAVDEIEEEVKREGGDLASMKDMLNIEQDLRQVKSDFRIATDDVNAITRGDEVRPREEPDVAGDPTPAAPARPAAAKGWWEDRDPNDPFVKLERSRAAAEAARVAAQAAKTATAATATDAEPEAEPEAEQSEQDAIATPTDRDGAST